LGYDRESPNLLLACNSLHRRKENAMSLRLLLTLCGGLEILAGSAALIIPATVVSLLPGSSLDAIASVVARLFGAGCWHWG
jgi:hypothetical protein